MNPAAAAPADRCVLCGELKHDFTYPYCYACLASKEYKVESKSQKYLMYSIFFSLRKKSWFCECKYFALRQEECSHIKRVKRIINKSAGPSPTTSFTASE